jgi:helicase MOV-10
VTTVFNRTVVALQTSRPFPMASICPRLLTSGTCPDSSCTHLHDVQFCDICGVNISSPAVQKSHFTGKKHRSKVLGISQLLHCKICDTPVISYNWSSHTSSRKHTKAASLQGASPLIEGERITTDIEGRKYCDLCRIHTPEAQWHTHTRSRTHKRLERFSSFRAALDEAERDKNGITIEGPTDFDIISPDVSITGVSLTLAIKMALPHLKVTLVGVSLMSAKGSRTSPYVRSFGYDSMLTKGLQIYSDH